MEEENYTKLISSNEIPQNKEKTENEIVEIVEEGGL